MPTQPAVWARSAFALGYAGDGTFPIPDRAQRECLAAQEAANDVPGPHLMRLVTEAGKDEGKRASRAAGHSKLYAYHSATLSALFAPVLAKVDTSLAPHLVDVATQQAHLDPVARRKVVAATALAGITPHLTSDGRKAMDAANADGWTHAYARGIGEAKATPASGGPPDPKKIAGFAAGALLVVPSATASSAGPAMTTNELNAIAMGAALAAGDGTAPDVAAKVASALLDTDRPSRTYIDGLHKVLSQAFLDQLKADNPNGQTDFVTSGGNVCPLCLEIEGANPWQTDSVPVPPQHFSCMCHLELARESVDA